MIYILTAILYNIFMGLKICSFASGSKGNCIYVASEASTILIDAGIATKRIEQCLNAVGASPAAATLLITHSHSDHIAALSRFWTKYACPVYCQAASEAVLSQKCCPTVFEGEFTVGDIVVVPFNVSHDVPCVGYSFYYGNKKLSIVTDIGRMTPEVMNSLTGSDVVLIEANHDETMLRANSHYSYGLKQRILSPKGHLSNDACAAAAAELAVKGTRQLILAHLSMENNTPELAYNTVCSRLADMGVNDGEDISIEVAQQYRVSSIFEIC